MEPKVIVHYLKIIINFIIILRATQFEVTICEIPNSQISKSDSWPARYLKNERVAQSYYNSCTGLYWFRDQSFHFKVLGLAHKKGRDWTRPWKPTYLEFTKPKVLSFSTIFFIMATDCKKNQHHEVNSQALTIGLVVCTLLMKGCSF